MFCIRVRVSGIPAARKVGGVNAHFTMGAGEDDLS